jgi:hypothetical protein
MNSVKYVGLDVHQATISVAVLDTEGKLVMQSILATHAAAILDFLHGLRGSLEVTFEEGTHSAWLYDLLVRHVARVVVCNPRRNALLKAGVESHKHDAVKLLCTVPFLGPIRAACLLARVQTPHRFRTKRQFWAYCGLALETRTSAEYRFEEGQLVRAKKPVFIRGLNANHNHDLKNLFKSAATAASTMPGPFHSFYENLLLKGIHPARARLTLARKIAAIALCVWKKGEPFNAEYLKPQAA